MTTTVPVTLLFADGAARRFQARRGQSVVASAIDAGLDLLTDCGNGQCGTCTAQVVSGSIELGAYDRAVLSDADRAAGSILTCISRITGPCVVEMPYDSSEATAERAPPMTGTVRALERIAKETIRLELSVDRAVDFQPGQFVRMRPAQGDAWRSYSMANVSGASALVFYVRLVEGGEFSSWLTGPAAVGCAVELSAPHGSFFLRDEPRPRLFVAGGTGLAPFLSMLETIASSEGADRWPTTLLLGVRTSDHLFALDQLAALQTRCPKLSVRVAAEFNADQRCHHSGYATELIGTLGITPDTRVYLCGPPPMVEAGRDAAQAVGLPRREMLCERFNLEAGSGHVPALETLHEH
jgi:3-phenylpropionate/trans-cinnamate dioxygenase ferredoxin reductase subunit